MSIWVLQVSSITLDGSDDESVYEEKMRDIFTMLMYVLEACHLVEGRNTST